MRETRRTMERPKPAPRTVLPSALGRRWNSSKISSCSARCDADAGVPDADEQAAGVALVADEYAAGVGVAQRVGDQVAQDAGEEVRVGLDGGGAGEEAEAEFAAGGDEAVLLGDAAHHLGGGEAAGGGRGDAGV